MAKAIKARVGEQVQVDISGLEAPGISIGAGVFSTGKITEIDAQNDEITVQLDVSFGGKDVVTVAADRAELIPSPGADVPRAAVA